MDVKSLRKSLNLKQSEFAERNSAFPKPTSGTWNRAAANPH
jgi:DNA-binding transcriptional regulator YiaG